MHASCFMLHTSTHRGFSLLEILVVIAIAATLFTIVANVFSSYEKQQALDKDAEKIRSFLLEARGRTLSSRELSSYGVHFETSRTVLFRGSSYSASDPGNLSQPLRSEVEISNIALGGGGSDVIFARLTGATTGAGTVTLRLKSDTSQMRIITIRGTGVVE